MAGNHLPDIFIPRNPYTDKTNVFVPILARFAQGGAIMGIEWTTLSYIEHAPLVARVATFVVSLFILAIIQLKDWLAFKGKHYFVRSLLFLFALYVGICLYAFRSIGYESPVVYNASSTASQLLSAEEITKATAPIQAQLNAVRSQLSTAREQNAALTAQSSEWSAAALVPSNKADADRLLAELPDLYAIFKTAQDGFIPVLQRAGNSLPVIKDDCSVVDQAPSLIDDIRSFNNTLAQFMRSHDYDRTVLMTLIDDSNRSDNNMFELIITLQDYTSLIMYRPIYRPIINGEQGEQSNCTIQQVLQRTSAFIPRIVQLNNVTARISEWITTAQSHIIMLKTALEHKAAQ